MADQVKRRGKGCLFYAAIVAGIMLIVLVTAAYLGFRYARNLVNDFTAPHPVSLPAIEFSEEEWERLRQRIGAFGKTVREGGAVEPLTLTDDEVNALIQHHPTLETWRGRVYLWFEERTVNAMVSIPVEQLGWEPLRGRYLNATGTFAVTLKGNAVHVNVDTLSAQGRPLPDNVMRRLRTENLARDWADNPEVARVIGGLEQIRIHNEGVTLVPKQSVR